MFSGIVEESAEIIGVEEHAGGHRVTIAARGDLSDMKVGDSLCTDGVCLTVVSLATQNGLTSLSFDIASETLRCTTLGETVARLTDDTAATCSVHIERSLAIGERLHGHFVTGHVDGVGTVCDRTEEGNTVKLTIAPPAPEEGETASRSLATALIAPKGSIAVAGVALTVGEVDESTFSVYIIPHTGSVTRLATLRRGDRVNIEFDILARYVARLSGGEFFADRGDFR
ncbi:riboflavin synthase [bacterium]|nr:riboflavin synthase [bacterium]